MDQRRLLSFLLFWATGSILFLLVSIISPENVVVGNISLTTPIAAIVSGLALSLLVEGSLLVVSKLDLKIKSPYFEPLVVLGSSLVSIWIIKRLADVTGLGVSSILFVVILALGATVLREAESRGLKEAFKNSKKK